MQHITAFYLGKIGDKEDWLFNGKCEFRPGWCKHQVNIVCQDIADSLDNRSRIDTIMIHFFLVAFHLDPHDQLLTKISVSEVDSRIFVWLRESFWAIHS
jgi:hypothetical protein